MRRTRHILDRLRAHESRHVTFIDADGSWPIVWERARGVHVWDAGGKKYPDLTGGFPLRALKALLHRGFILLPEGEHANVISFTPPLTITQAQLRQTVHTLADTLHCHPYESSGLAKVLRRGCSAELHSAVSPSCTRQGVRKRTSAGRERNDPMPGPSPPSRPARKIVLGGGSAALCSLAPASTLQLFNASTMRP